MDNMLVLCRYVYAPHGCQMPKTTCVPFSQAPRSNTHFHFTNRGITNSKQMSADTYMTCSKYDPCDPGRYIETECDASNGVTSMRAALPWRSARVVSQQSTSTRVGKDVVNRRFWTILATKWRCKWIYLGERTNRNWVSVLFTFEFSFHRSFEQIPMPLYTQRLPFSRANDLENNIVSVSCEKYKLFLSFMRFSNLANGIWMRFLIWMYLLVKKERLSERGKGTVCQCGTRVDGLIHYNTQISAILRGHHKC